MAETVLLVPDLVRQHPAGQGLQDLLWDPPRINLSHLGQPQLGSKTGPPRAALSPLQSKRGGVLALVSRPTSRQDHSTGLG